MFTTFHRIGGLTAMLVLAAGATAFASVTIEPSNSITLQPRVRGMAGGGDIDRERVTITAMSRTGKVNLTSNTCRPLMDVSNYKTSDTETTGSSKPTELEYTASIHLASKSQEGSCVLTFSDGGHTAAVHVRIVKP